MDRSVCFIGNSHLVALKLAWDQLKPATAGVSIDMFGSAMDSLAHIEFVDGKIVPKGDRVRQSFQMTAGSDVIELSRYDAFVIVACGYDIEVIVDQFSSHSFYGCETKAPHLSSFGAFKAASIDAMSAMTADKTVSLIRRGSNAPIYIFPQPYRSDAVLTVAHPRGKYDLLKSLIVNGDENRVYDLYKDVCAAYSASRSVHVIEQPTATKSGAILTHSTYNEDAIRLQPGFEAKHRRLDCTHMNTAFGIATLKDFFSKADFMKNMSVRASE